MKMASNKVEAIVKPDSRLNNCENTIDSKFTAKDILKVVEIDVEPNNPTEACSCRCVGHCSCDCDRVTLAF